LALSSSGTQRVSVDNLLFDDKNPRFADAKSLGHLDDKSIIKFYLEQVDLRELLDSITSSGYIDFDPMLVQKSGQKYSVLEGNRRLAALKLLRDNALAKKLGLADISMSSTQRATLDAINVRVMPNRKAARAYIGFKHINGPHKWDSMAKAQYAAEWLRDGGSLDTIAKTLGDRNNLVRRLVFGRIVLDQAEANGFDRAQITSRNFSFSHLYTALTRPGFRAFLSLKPNDLSFNPKRRPIKPSRIRALQDVMGWLYGQKNQGIDAVVKSQNPDINRLNEVLQRPDAKRFFIASKNLDGAYEFIEPASTRFSEPLFAALSNTQRALSLVIYFDGSRRVKAVAEDLVDSAEALLKAMSSPKSNARKTA